MLHMPSPMLIGSDGSYGAFQAYVAATATTVAGWNQGLADFASNKTRIFKTTATVLAPGGLYGSPWGTYFAMNAGVIGRVVQHGLPSYAAYADQVAGGRDILVRTSNAGTRDLLAVSRNGFVSSASTEPDTLATWCEEILYFADGQAWRMTPRSSGGPTLFTVP